MVSFWQMFGYNLTNIDMEISEKDVDRDQVFQLSSRN